MWDVNIKETNEQDKQRLRDMNNELVATRGRQQGRIEEVDWVKEVKYRELGEGEVGKGDQIYGS